MRFPELGIQGGKRRSAPRPQPNPSPQRPQRCAEIRRKDKSKAVRVSEQKSSQAAKILMDACCKSELLCSRFSAERERPKYQSSGFGSNHEPAVRIDPIFIFSSPWLSASVVQRFCLWWGAHLWEPVGVSSGLSCPAELHSSSHGRAFRCHRSQGSPIL